MTPCFYCAATIPWLVFETAVRWPLAESWIPRQRPIPRLQRPFGADPIVCEMPSFRYLVLTERPWDDRMTKGCVFGGTGVRLMLGLVGTFTGGTLGLAVALTGVVFAWTGGVFVWLVEGVFALFIGGVALVLMTGFGLVGNLDSACT